jgi:AcrR family transcriptional regulator
MREFLLVTLENISDRGRIPVSVTALAKAAKISRSTIYKYYPDIIAKMKGGREYSYGLIEDNGLKVAILKKQLKELQCLVGVLTKVCSVQMIEIIEQKAKYNEELESKHIQLAHLESALAKTRKPVLKTVK